MIMGMNNRWKITRGLFFNLFYERTQVTDQGKSTFNSFNPALYSATNSNLNPAIYSAANNDFLDEGSRDAVSFGVEYLAKDYIKAGGKYEFRYHNRDESKPQHFDYYQFTTLNTLGIQVSRDLTFLFRLNYAQTRNVTEKWDQAKNLETSVGLALRPVNYDWANLVAKYSRLISLRPISLENQLKQKSVSDIFTVMPVFELPMRLQLVEKVAIKLVQEQYEDLPGAKNVVVLWINRLNFHLTDFIDLGTEYRLLRQSWGSNIPMGELFKSKKGKSSIVESGFLFELAFLPVKYLSLGIGYNFTSFNDNEYQDVNRDASGMFFRMVGKY